MREYMSENQLPSETDAVLHEVDAILKEPKFLAEINTFLDQRKPEWIEALRKSSPTNRDLAACLALGQELSIKMPSVANRLQIFEMLTTVNDPTEGIISRIHNIMAFVDEKGHPINIIDPTFNQYNNTQPFFVGHRDKAYPNYRVAGDTREVIPVKVDPLSVTEFMDRNGRAINNFRQALQAKS
jgi:hypothetical protein